MDAEAVNRVVEALRSGVGTVKFGEEHVVALCPPGYTVKDLSEVLPPPNRPKQKVIMLTVASFIEYCNRFGKPESAFFANRAQRAFEYVVDYHKPDGSRGTCDHLVRHVPQRSLEAAAWEGCDGKLGDQEGFARFIERNIQDVRNPPGARMLEIALGLQVRKDASFVSGLRLESGETQLRYEEQIRGTTKAGDLTIPAQFSIAIPIFHGGPRYEVEARLVYRLDNKGGLTIGYELIRYALVVEEAIAAITAQISKGITVSNNVYEGGRAE